MPTLTFSTKYRKNTGAVMSPSELLSVYLYGVAIQSQDGTDFSEQDIQFYLESAQQEVERFLNIKLQLQLFNDNVSFNRAEYYNEFPIMRTRYPVNTPLSLTGFYKKIEQISYPQEWLSSTQNSDGAYQRRMSIVPTSGSAVGTSQDVILTGITVQWGSLRGLTNLPDYWNMQYVTGYDCENIPMDVVNVIGKFAAIGLFNIAGDLILGAGIASQSLGLDSLSQSISSTSSATSSGYGARIIQYSKEIDQTLKRIKNNIKGINLTVL